MIFPINTILFYIEKNVFIIIINYSFKRIATNIHVYFENCDGTKYNLSRTKV